MIATDCIIEANKTPAMLQHSGDRQPDKAVTKEIIPKPPTGKKGGFYMDDKDTLVFVLNTTRDDFIDWFYSISEGAEENKVNWKPNLKQDIEEAAQRFGTEKRLSKILGKHHNWQPRERAHLRLVFGDVSNYPGAILDFYALPIDDAHVEITAKFTNDKDRVVFGEALKRITQTFPSLKDELPDASKAIPEVKIDAIDESILGYLKKDLRLSDSQLGQKVGISRQAINTRRRALEKAGYTVR